MSQSSVRLQWDPDHHPSGPNLERRAIQLGLRGPTVEKYAREWIMSIEDISDFVHEQHEHVKARQYERLVTPREAIYPVEEPLASKLGVGRESAP